MRRSGVTATILAGLTMVGCTEQGPQRTAISTPTSEQLKWQRDQARVTPAGAGAVIAAGLAMQLSGAAQDGQIVVPGHYRRKHNIDLARTDASEVPLTSPIPPAQGKPSVTPVDPAMLAAAGAAAPPLAPLVVKLPPDMQ